jgi:membrane protein YdbS with pleckstrin-like domain
MIKFEEGEHIIHTVRRHWFVILGFTIVLFIIALLPLAAIKFFSSELFTSAFPIELKQAIPVGDLGNWIQFGYPLWLLLLWVFFFIEWTDYYLDIWVITNKRIIDIEQKGFFHREVTSFSYGQVQDITVETRGPIQTFFKFGLLEIQTAGHNRNIIIPHADNPEIVRSIVLKQQHTHNHPHTQPTT